MSIVFQTDKRVGITYAYENESYWDKEKKQPRSRRKLVGRLDEETGQVVPTHQKKPAPPEPVSKRASSGATYMFDEIVKVTGVKSDLRECFPDSYSQILSIAYYLILEDRNSLSRFPKWGATHRHPYGKDISSQRSSDLFASVTEDAKNKFFTLRGGRKKEREHWFYDTTSISSYSECLKQVRYGKNKDQEDIEQINLAVLFGEESQLPFYYRKLPGNITDVKTIKNLIKDIDQFEYKKIKLVMDRGFYSEDNVNAMLAAHLKFLIGVKVSLTLVQDVLVKVREKMRDFSHYDPDSDLYSYSETIAWHYVQERPYKGDRVEEERRMYLHLYFSGEKALEDERKFNTKLVKLKEELESEGINITNEKACAKYFEVKSTPKRGVRVTVKQKVIENAKKNFGYFAMISNESREPGKALDLYRSKDLVEKAFENLKERLSFRRTLVSSEQSLDGKLFVEFVALIIMSFIKKKMQEAGMFRTYTMQEMLDQIDLIERFDMKGRAPRYGEITKKQREIYETLGFNPPGCRYF
jgi:transposase